MVVCICRDIRDSEYSDRNELIERLLQDDLSCGKCLEEFVDPNLLGRSGHRDRYRHLKIKNIINTLKE